MVAALTQMDAALYDAALVNLDSRLLWLDLDTWFQRPLDARFWSWCDKFDVATIIRKRYYPETGIAFYAPTARRLHLLEAARAAYSITPHATIAAKPAAGGFNDVQVFGHLFARSSSLRIGAFAVGCRPSVSMSGPDAQWVQEARPYKVKPRQHYCPSETMATSPWNLFEYITHKKHSSGPMGRRSTDVAMVRQASKARRANSKAWRYLAQDRACCCTRTRRCSSRCPASVIARCPQRASTQVKGSGRVMS